MKESSLTLYGIKNCDTVKKARKFLQTNGVACTFHDYRVDGLDALMLQRFIDKLGWEILLNTRGTTWRKLSETQRAAVTDADSARDLMLAHPAIIKRPLLCGADGSMLPGFSESAYTQFIQEQP
ncbi:ArsC family reductase [Erwinia sp. 9145]|uniref:ArsC family reductase n=1 Tax=Erwinia sp. 9145 TaxID=1500895 RepID=UPI000550DC4E|nr:ArsC family reductase [Erwinia sp. 9145]